MRSIMTFINIHETDVLKFKPNNQFYKKVGINQKRWGLIYRGETEPLVCELQRIATYFNVDIKTLIDSNSEIND